MHPRSGQTAQSFLEQTASELKLGAIAIANEDGLLVFGSLGPASGLFDLEALAAIGPLVAGGQAPKDLVSMASSGKPVRSCRFEIDGQTLFVTSVGPKGPERKVVESALREILAA
jgi:hypothetical protein